MGWAVYIRGCSTYFKYARRRVFLLFWVKLVGGKWPFWAFHIARSQANTLLFYLKSVQPKVFLSLWGNRWVIKPKTLFSHRFYVSTKLASEKGRHTHIPVSLEKQRVSVFPYATGGPSRRKAHLHTQSCTGLWCEERFREEGQVHREIPAAKFSKFFHFSAPGKT